MRGQSGYSSDGQFFYIPVLNWNGTAWVPYVYPYRTECEGHGSLLHIDAEWAVTKFPALVEAPKWAPTFDLGSHISFAGQVSHLYSRWRGEVCEIRLPGATVAVGNIPKDHHAVHIKAKVEDCYQRAKQLMLVKITNPPYKRDFDYTNWVLPNMIYEPKIPGLTM